MHDTRSENKAQLQNSFILPAVLLFTAGAITLGAVSANAYFGQGQYHDEMVKKLSEKLGVEESKIEAVFAEMQKEKQQEMRARFEERLKTAVTNGEITEAQKNTIIAKHDELVKKHKTSQEAFQSMTPQERRDSRQAERDELSAWAQSQGIDLKYFAGPKGGHMGVRGGMMNWDN